MSALLIRSTDFEVSGDGRTLEGLAFRWDYPASVQDYEPVTGRLLGPRYLEEFDPRSADQTLKMRGLRPLFVKHEYLLGSVGETGFAKSGEGLTFSARITDSRYGLSTLERVGPGRELPAVSVGYRSLRQARRTDPCGTVTRRLEIAIEELSLAEEGQHAGAGVLTVRSEPGTPNLDQLRRRRLTLFGGV